MEAKFTIKYPTKRNVISDRKTSNIIPFFWQVWCFFPRIYKGLVSSDPVVPLFLFHPLKKKIEISWFDLIRSILWYTWSERNHRFSFCRNWKGFLCSWGKSLKRCRYKLHQTYSTLMPIEHSQRHCQPPVNQKENQGENPHTHNKTVSSELDPQQADCNNINILGSY